MSVTYNELFDTSKQSERPLFESKLSSQESVSGLLEKKESM
jgi:hypothetical protein